MKPDEREWFYEIGFTGPVNVELVEMVEAAGCRWVYGFGVHDPERKQPGQPVELERAESRALAAEERADELAEALREALNWIDEEPEYDAANAALSRYTEEE